MDNEQFKPSNAQSPQVEPSVKDNKNVKALVLTALVVALVVGAGVFFWMNGKLTSSRDKEASLQQQNEDLKSEMATEATDNQEAATTAPEEDNKQSESEIVAANVLGTGQVKYGDSGGGRMVIFDCFQGPGTLTNIWVRYGTSLDSLKDTDKFTRELGMGDPGSFISYAVFTNASNLKAGSAHFYQCAATKDGNTIYSNFSVFTAEK